MAFSGILEIPFNSITGLACFVHAVTSLFSKGRQNEAVTIFVYPFKVAEVLLPRINFMPV